MTKPVAWYQPNFRESAQALGGYGGGGAPFSEWRTSFKTVSASTTPTTVGFPTSPSLAWDISAGNSPDIAPQRAGLFSITASFPLANLSEATWPRSQGSPVYLQLMANPQTDSIGVTCGAVPISNNGASPNLVFWICSLAWTQYCDPAVINQLHLMVRSQAPYAPGSVSVAVTVNYMGTAS